MVSVALVGGSGLTFDTAEPPPDVDRLLRQALTEKGAYVRQVDWRDPDIDLSEADVAVVRTCWDYTADVAGFLAWADRTAQTTRLINSPETLRWSSDKRYLAELAAAGVPAVPTMFVEVPVEMPVETGGTHAGAETLSRLLAEKIEETAETHRCSEVIVKPTVGVGADGVVRLPVRAPAGRIMLPEGPLAVQPYRPGIRDGEISVVMLSGEISHATCKRPAEGEFRIQSIYGGTYRPCDPGRVRRTAEAAYSLIPGRPEICRIDLMAGPDGYEVSEVEAIEPDLYLETHPEAASRLSDLILDAAGSA